MAESHNTAPYQNDGTRHEPSSAAEPKNSGSVDVAVGQEAKVKGDCTSFRRYKYTSIGFCLVLVVTLVIVLVVLIFTVFKVKNPVVSVKNVVLEDFNFRLQTPTLIPQLNLTLKLELSVKNPNHASFKYTNSTAFVYFHDLEIAEAAIPAGSVGARGTVTFFTALKLMANRIISSPNFITDLISGSFPVSTHTSVSGRVNVANIFRRHADASTDCNMVISVQNRSIQNMECHSHVSL